MMHPTRAARIVLVLTLATMISSLSCPPQHAKAQAVPAMPTTQTTKSNTPPPTPREFRAAWVATVGNIDWPSQSGLSAEQQKSEIVQILDRAKEINLNVIVLQVRTTADALYESKLEPWSAFLTGTQGKSPGYDPLTFWVEQAHQRGIELHAWFNPYRTQYGGSKVEPADTHISKTHPELVKSYGKYGWMDPGEPAAQEHSFNVFMDVVDRYDVDGIHIDDYFYPYPEPLNPKDKDDKREAPFPDDPSYQKYTDAGGKLKREDWRRESIDKLIHRIYEGIRKRKKNVQFGISPFGIPRPGLEGIEYVKGFDQHDKLYADTVKWLQNGWCDYFAPQLYWKVGAPNQPFLGLVRWWTQNNPKGRHIYPGLFTSRIDFSDTSWSPDEILGQIMVTRLTPGAGGNVHFSMVALDQNRRKVSDMLRDVHYAQPALVPATPWLDNDAPAAPTDVKSERGPEIAPPATRLASEEPAEQSRRGRRRGDRGGDGGSGPATTRAATKPFIALSTQPAPKGPVQSVRVTWQPAEGEKAWLWSIAYHQGPGWKYQVIPGDKTETILPDDATAGPATQIAVAAVDRSGNESRRTVIKTGLEKEPAPAK
jgi:uncharacterized lipoprotein YddW (UPF0748 family)